MKLLEIVRGKDSSHETIATSIKLGRTMQKVVGVCGNCDGFLANRSRIPFKFEMTALLEEGVMPEQVDKVMHEFGYPMGPFAVGDLSGLDIGYATRKRRAMEDPENHVPDPISDAWSKPAAWDRRPAPGISNMRKATARRDPIRRSGRSSRASRASSATNAATSATRKSLTASCWRRSMNAAAFWKKASPTAPATST